MIPVGALVTVAGISEMSGEPGVVTNYETAWLNWPERYTVLLLDRGYTVYLAPEDVTRRV